jgi:hypothetical protein
MAAASASHQVFRCHRVPGRIQFSFQSCAGLIPPCISALHARTTVISITQIYFRANFVRFKASRLFVIKCPWS